MPNRLPACRRHYWLFLDCVIVRLEVTHRHRAVRVTQSYHHPCRFGLNEGPLIDLPRVSGVNIIECQCNDPSFEREVSRQTTGRRCTCCALLEPRIIRFVLCRSCYTLTQDHFAFTANSTTKFLSPIPFWRYRPSYRIAHSLTWHQSGNIIALNMVFLAFFFDSIIWVIFLRVYWIVIGYLC